MRFSRVLLVDPGLRVICPNVPHILLGYLSEFLGLRGVEHAVFDMKLGYGLDDLIGKVKSFGADLVVFHPGMFLVDSTSMQKLFHIVSALKSSSSASVLLGGPHVVLLGSKVLSSSCADYAVRGDLESPVYDLCSGVGDLDGIPGLIWKSGSSVVDNGGCSYTRLDGVPFPRYELFKIDKYAPSSMSINTSRGCAHRCIFCYHPLINGSSYRSRGVEDVLGEMRYWYSRGYRLFIITDDNFGFDESRLRRICCMVRDCGFPGIEINVLNIRVDSLNDDILWLMRQAGFKSLGFGVESGSDSVLKTLRKGFSSKEINAVLSSACALGFNVKLYLLVDAPGKGWLQLADMLRLAWRYPVKVSMSTLMPVPGTELFDWVKQRKYFLIEPDKYLLFSSSRIKYTPLFRTDEMGAIQKHFVLVLGLILVRLLNWRLRVKGIVSTKLNAAYRMFGSYPIISQFVSVVESVYLFVGGTLGKTRIPVSSGGWPLRLRPYPQHKPVFGSGDYEAVGSVLRSRNLTMFSGFRVREFEKRFAEYVGSEYAVAVSSGTAALHCSLLAAGVGPGDEVIVPAFTYVSTAMAVLYVGAVPRFVDVGFSDANLDASLVECAITDNTRAIIPVHFGGVPCDMKRLRELSSERGIFLIEDAAQAVGSVYGGRKVGSIGDIGCFSFQETKNLTCGEGGMVVTDDVALANRIRLARHLGESYGDGSSTSGVIDYLKPVRYDVIGFNYRLSELHAALGLSQIGRINEFARARRRNAACIMKVLGDIEFIDLPKSSVEADPCYNFLPLTITEGSPLSRDEFVIKLHCEGVPFILPYQTILPYNRVFNIGGDFPNARRFYESGLMLYVDPVFTEMDMMDVTSTIRRLFEYQKKI